MCLFCLFPVCWSSQSKCDHLLNIINKETGIVIGEMSPLSMFYCNTCGERAALEDNIKRAKPLYLLTTYYIFSPFDVAL